MTPSNALTRSPWGQLHIWPGWPRKTAVLLAVWLETTALLQDRAEELGDFEGAAPLVEPAGCFARSYLRTDTTR
ncbi:hypothetical protein [Streptomyces decoyicus]|uniref:hypothetical protein n=1 Tax=Streptomyces decoyicus TaxID=249567 RepID=UPI003669E87D